MKDARININISENLPILAVILPCYNEEEMLPLSLETIKEYLDGLIASNKIGANSFILCVDDGSKDETWTIIKQFNSQFPGKIKGLKLAGNAGHQHALLAGMLALKDSVDCAISIDADLQDDITAMDKMIDDFKAGSRVVYGVRNDRTSDSWLKRTTANLFYAGIKLLGTTVIPGHADYRLVDNLTLQALAECGEANLFLRTLLPSMNLPSSYVFYARKERLAGETKYPLRKMISFALRGIATSSPVPLRLAAILGLITLSLAVLQSVFVIFSYITGGTIHGWTSLIMAVLYLGAVQLLCIAVLGEYIARIFTEVKHRPRYIVEKEV